MAELIRVTPDAELDEVVEILERDGVLIIENYLTDAEHAALWEDLGPSLDTDEFSDNWYDGFKTRRVSSLFARTTRLTPVVTHPLYLGAARRILQKPIPMWIGRSRQDMVPTIQISATQLIQIHPGEGNQPLHRDDALHLRSHPGPESRLQIMVAMSEFTAENGGTRMIPGSHLWDNDRPPTVEETIPTEMAPGSAVIWTGGVYHSGGKNTSSFPRTGLTISFDLGNLRQEENQYLVVPREQVLAYPEEVRRLLGYDRCPPGLGWVEMENPYVVLERDEEAA
jgi:hypothetical protein